jgi:hypothetical protein
MIAASTNFRAPDDAITKTWSPTELVSWGCFKVENHGTIIAISSFQSIKSKLTFAKKGLGRLKNRTALRKRRNNDIAKTSPSLTAAKTSQDGRTRRAR